MRRIYLTILILFLGFTTVKAQETVDAQEVIEVEAVKTLPTINWETSYKEAVAKAKAENKPLLVYFTGSDWCGICKLLDKKLFNTKKFVDEYATDKMVVYKADFPLNKDLITQEMRKTNIKLKDKFLSRFKNKKGKIPAPVLLMLNSNEEEIGIKKGMYIIDYYYTFFDKAIQNN